MTHAQEGLIVVQGCHEWLEKGRAEGVHQLMTELLGQCPCESPIERVARLYVVDQAREVEQRMTA